MRINKLDIVEALLGVPPEGMAFDEGDVVACLAFVPFGVNGGVPLLLRSVSDTDHTFLVPVFKAGTSREEVKQRLTEAVDSLFDTVHLIKAEG